MQALPFALLRLVVRLTREALVSEKANGQSGKDSAAGASVSTIAIMA